MKKLCENYKELEQECACMRNKCLRCSKSVDNITFTVCDDCCGDEHKNNKN